MNKQNQNKQGSELQQKPNWNLPAEEVPTLVQEDTLREQSLEEFLNNINEDINPPRSLQITKNQAEAIIKHFAVQQKLNINQATVAISILLQSGGTARGCDGNLSCSVFGQTIKLAYLRKALTDLKLKGQERKLAKVMADDIAKICTKFKHPGNLTNKIKRLNPDRQFKLDETVWLSDFQVDNENCPELLRRFITDSFDKKPNTKQQQNNKKKNTGK